MTSLEDSGSNRRLLGILSTAGNTIPKFSPSASLSNEQQYFSPSRSAQTFSYFNWSTEMRALNCN